MVKNEVFEARFERWQSMAGVLRSLRERVSSCENLSSMRGFGPASDEFCDQALRKGIWWMPWYREAMKDVARCDKPGGDASDR